MVPKINSVKKDKVHIIITVKTVMSVTVVLQVLGDSMTSNSFTQHYHFFEQVLVNLSFKHV